LHSWNIPIPFCIPLEQNPNLAGSSAKSDSVEFPELARFCQILDSKVLVPIHQKLVN